MVCLNWWPIDDLLPILLKLIQCRFIIRPNVLSTCRLFWSSWSVSEGLVLLQDGVVKREENLQPTLEVQIVRHV